MMIVRREVRKKLLLISHNVIHAHFFKDAVKFDIRVPVPAFFVKKDLLIREYSRKGLCYETAGLSSVLCALQYLPNISSVSGW